MAIHQNEHLLIHQNSMWLCNKEEMAIQQNNIWLSVKEKQVVIHRQEHMVFYLKNIRWQYCRNILGYPSKQLMSIAVAYAVACVNCVFMYKPLQL